MSDARQFPVDIDNLTRGEFDGLPLVIRGESKEVRYAGLDRDGRPTVVIRFIPTVYSFTHNRCAELPGSEVPRLRASRRFVEVLAKSGIRHAYRAVNDRWVLADLVMPHKAEFDKYGLPVFRHPDLTPEVLARTPKAPPIEVVVKNCLTGTTKHGCIGLAGSRVRDSHPFYAGRLMEPDGALPEMLVRFDWRNPLKSEPCLRRVLSQAERKSEAVSADLGRLLAGTSAGEVRGEAGTPVRLSSGDVRRITEYFARHVFGLERVADTVLPSQLADLFIDVKVARRTAFLAAKSIEDFLASRDIVFYDICLFITEDGGMLYGEVSPDCGRYRHLDLGELDKDVWRSGGSSRDVIDKWLLLCELMGVTGDDEAAVLGEIPDEEEGGKR
jgi:hypothetical protein